MITQPSVFCGLGFNDIETTERLAALFPDYEVLGYVMDYNFDNLGHKMFSLMIKRGNKCILATADLNEKEDDCVSYVTRDDFEPYWFENRDWKWRSLQDFNFVISCCFKTKEKF